MHELASPPAMRAWSRGERARGRRIAFVPTMGFLHEGHLRLVDHARERADPLVRVDPGPLAATLEGSARPGHFAGVLTVVTKLFHWVEPDVAVFGRKDFQQALLVERLAADLDFPVEIAVRPTVRELDGLALSSRNAYLTPDERRAALALSRALRAVEQAWRGGEADPRALVRRGMELLATPGVTPEYLVLVDRSLQPVARVDARTVALVAAKV